MFKIFSLLDKIFIQIISNHADISDMKMFSETFLDSPQRLIKFDARKINHILGTNNDANGIVFKKNL